MSPNATNNKKTTIIASQALRETLSFWLWACRKQEKERREELPQGQALIRLEEISESISWEILAIRVTLKLCVKSKPFCLAYCQGKKIVSSKSELT